MTRTLRSGVLLAMLGARALAADHTNADRIEQLKAALASQQKEIDELRALLRAQQTLVEKALERTGAAPAAQGADRSTPSTPLADPTVVPASSPANRSLTLSLGGLQFAPTGFFEYGQVWRTRTVPSGFPTNFAAIPFGNTVYGQRRQTISTAAGSRFGFRVGTTFRGFHLLGVTETDFLGYQPGNLTTTSNSYGLRLRLAFADLKKDKWELVSGQSWSLLTPGRKGISPLPETLFLTQDVDPNILTRLVWARTPQVRLAYHPTERIAMAASFESGDTYAGGSAGSGQIVLPTAFAPDYFGQIDTGNGGSTVPTPNADLIAKIAFDPDFDGRALHLEFAGLLTPDHVLQSR